jgi:penicillin-binding protein 1C
MQLARRLHPRRRTAAAKLIESLRALQLDAALGKRGVLAAYLTLAPYGGDLEGVRAASMAWFGHAPDHLDDAEQALLIALPQAPEARRPDRHPAAARAARARILARMERAGLIWPPGTWRGQVALTSRTWSPPSTLASRPSWRPWRAAPPRRRAPRARSRSSSCRSTIVRCAPPWVRPGWTGRAGGST